MKNKKVLSLFSGCGGMDLGFEGGFVVPLKSIKNKEWISKKKKGWAKLKETSFETNFACDIKPSAQTVWEKYFGRSDYHLQSIVDLVKLARENQFQFPEADIITGGFPCQDFSVAGKRKGLESMKGHDAKNLAEPSVENRGMLYYWMREVIDLVQPKMFVAENVKGLVSLGDVKEIIANDFRNVGGGYFVFDPIVLHAGDYGVPQTRQRVFFIGVRLDSINPKILKKLQENEKNPDLYPYPSPSHDWQSGDFVSVGDVLLDLQEPENSTDKNQQAYSKARWYGKHCQGQSEVALNKLGPTIRSEHHGNIEFRRLSRENGGVIQSEYHLPERRLTVRECARIQTFPDDFDLMAGKVSGSEAYKLVGNAVPPLLAYHIAKRIEEVWPLYFKG